MNRTSNAIKKKGPESRFVRVSHEKNLFFPFVRARELESSRYDLMGYDNIRGPRTLIKRTGDLYCEKGSYFSNTR